LSLETAYLFIEARDVLARFEPNSLYGNATQMIQAGQEQPAAHAATVPSAGDHRPRDHGDRRAGNDPVASATDDGPDLIFHDPVSIPRVV
jgi:hypothetical protein